MAFNPQTGRSWRQVDTWNFLAIQSKYKLSTYSTEDHLWKCGEHCEKGMERWQVPENQWVFCETVSPTDTKSFTTKISQTGLDRYELTKEHNNEHYNVWGGHKRLQHYTKSYRQTRNSGSRRSGLAQKQHTNWLPSTKGQSALKAFTQVT